MPIGPLMVEHRLIEKMIGLLVKEKASIEKTGRANRDLIDAAADFFRTYADRTHHGKEEDILFRALEKKPLSAEHRKIMSELVAEHGLARQNVKGLAEAHREYSRGENQALSGIVGYLAQITRLYPELIRKEDERFFIPVMGYFGEDERDVMLSEFFAFDRGMIHEKYRKVVERYGS
jgi:hemerythrin-like domain-containing protein